jgi:hypothetical protein
VVNLVLAFGRARQVELDDFGRAAADQEQGADFGAAGQQAAWVRYPELRAVVIILTKDPNANAKAMAQQLADQLLR